MTFIHEDPNAKTLQASSKTAVAYFDSHAEYYEKNQYRTSRRTFVNGRHERLLAILAALDLTDATSILDAGCGPGNLVPDLARRAGRVCALDASTNMLRLARTNAARFKNVTYQAGNIETLPFADAAFDVVCSAGVIEYLQHCDRALAEMHRVLRPGGVLILPTTNVLAPAHWLRPVLEPIARLPVVARAFGLEPGRFRLYYHHIPRFKRRLRDAGFVLEAGRHFYLTLPRPLDRLFPGAARRIENLCDQVMDTTLRHLAEGYIAVARKPAARPMTETSGSVLQTLMGARS
jgi:ubiquinone/menaquinone biosynthesis C-methylase UbiE